MRVIVIGAGIGGLTLTQALHAAGVDVSCHDRDRSPEATGGYRLHLNDRACAALRRHLRPAHYQALLASSAGSGQRRFAIADHRLRVLATDPTDQARETLLIGRIALRVLLCHGLDDRVRFGATFTHHEVLDTGRVRAHFADGSTDDGDLLVGADGASSRVGAALAGRPTSAPVGVSGIAGRTPLTPALRPRVPVGLTRGPMLAFGPGGVGLFLTLHDPTEGTAVDPTTCVEIPAHVEEPGVVWGLLAGDRSYAPDARMRPASTLVADAVSMLDGWAPDVRALVAAADHGSTAFFAFRAADPDADLTPWPAGVVTALGDAVHAMPPTGGRAAATAIRDADGLFDALAEVRAGHSTIPLALRRHHLAMAAYAPDAVRTSLAPLRWQRMSSGPVATRLAPAATAVLGGVARLRGVR